ncbi:MAG: hypothetical protein ACYSTG_04835, partial [Planctomycetota bacterium]
MRWSAKILSGFIMVVTPIAVYTGTLYAPVPAITPNQIETDWLRQDQLYELEAARAAGESDTRPVDYNTDNTTVNFARV